MAEHIEKAIKTLKLDILDTNQSLVFVKEKTKLRPSQIAFGVIVLVAFLLLVLRASALITCIGCYLVPAYFSFNSLQQSNIQKDAKYLTYWVIFSVTEIFSFIFNWIFGPIIYSLIRVAFTAALIHPQVQLGQKIYNGFIAPYVMRIERILDPPSLLQKAKQKVDDIAQKASQAIEQQAKKIQ